MSKEIYISSTPHETRLAIVEDEALTEIYYERENEYTLAGSIYNGRVTRVLPGMQSSFVDIGLERDAFLYITDFMEETPDPDEFDTTSTGDRAPRASRPNGGVRQDDSGTRSEGSRDRGDRGGRGRRGGRDRDRGGDRAPLDRDRSEAPRAAAGNEPGIAPPPEGAESSQIGEGAPGADGNRRWRGRRGRRRGRGTSGQPGDPAQENTAPAGSESYPEDESFERESYTELDVAAPASEAPVDRVENAAPRSDRGRRDQGRGPRRDGQRFDSRRDQRSETRAPRGFAPSRDLYGVDSGEASGTGPIADAYADDPAAEPIILPGESLSKYRKGEESAASAPQTTIAAPVTLAPPANLYTLAEGWDGGATLPGETLSRRRPTESRHESERPRRDFDREPRRDREARFENRRDDRSDRRNAAPIAEQRTDEAVPSAPAEIAPEPIVASVEAVPVAPVAAAPEPILHVEAEYEPSEASASYRIDPAAPSEFRQSAPTLEPPVEEAEPIAEPETPAAELHDVTAIAASGEMLSEPAELLPAHSQHPAPIETPEPASPIHHEGAVLTPAADAEFAAPSAGGFAPGSSQLDEVTLDEEEEVPETLHASSIEELDDFEEETLEGAADLGTMLREMSIDNITRTLPEVDEEDTDEDDFEEDDLEEDEEERDEDDDQEDEGDQEGYQLGNRPEPASSEEGFDEQTARTGSPEDAEYFEQQFGQGGQENRSDEQSADAPSPGRERDSERRGGRRDGRRGRSDRDRGGDRSRGGRTGHSNGHGRHSVQATNLPAISDLLKPGQEILVQIAKEPIAKKGARITSHIALPGRFLVFMPTVNHTGVSRKIESDGERRRLKEILLSEKGDASGGFIVRTAAEGASEEELRSDLRFLLNLWADIKNRSESSKSPALIYHDLNLIERILRDQVTDNFSAIWVDSESEYERVLRFLQRFQPSLIRRVKLYLKETPLFEQFGITEEINKALRSKVWLKSGGSIVINQTEALVAIDINTGKFVGKTARLEDTIVKTNLDAIPEIVRQIRLRDLGGIIIIDFIDMDERKNRNRVMAALEDELKTDRAPSKVLQFNDFGLVAITRKRVKQSLERTLSTTCGVCTGTGMVKSPVTVCNDIYIEMRKMHKHLDRGDVMLRVHPEVVKQLKSSGAKWLQEMEEMVGKTILVKSDPSLHPEQFDIH
ncbi:MAG TPA: Rne/Rng family ribonuclease [Acidobacteriaceae bacterium]